MTTAEALTKFETLTTESRATKARVAAAEDFTTPYTDGLDRIRQAMTTLQATLCDLGVTNRMDLTLRDITDLLRMTGR